MEMEKQKVQSVNTLNLRGQLYAFILAGLSLGAAFYGFYKELDWMAGVFSAFSIGSLIPPFLKRSSIE
jgi:hypothetical protein